MNTSSQTCGLIHLALFILVLTVALYDYTDKGL